MCMVEYTQIQVCSTSTSHCYVYSLNSVLIIINDIPLVSRIAEFRRVCAPSAPFSARATANSYPPRSPSHTGLGPTRALGTLAGGYVRMLGSQLVTHGLHDAIHDALRATTPSFWVLVTPPEACLPRPDMNTREVHRLMSFLVPEKSNQTLGLKGLQMT